MMNDVIEIVAGESTAVTQAPAERAMATVQEVNGVYPIPDADKICQYGINGWKVVDQVGKYQVGDLVVFAEVDSWIPNTVAPFLTKTDRFPRLYNEVPGEKLRTIRLRKALSQGLILPLSVLGADQSAVRDWAHVGLDVTGHLGIQKWEPPAEFSSADAKGNFPDYGRKSNQERIQNCFRDIERIAATTTFEVTEKIEGQSSSIFYRNGEFEVCSRNLNLKESDNTFWNTALQYDLRNKMAALGRNLQIISEQCGPGISGNIYQMTEYRLFVFDIFDIDNQCYLTPTDRKAVVAQLGLTDAPVLDYSVNLSGMTLDEILKLADGISVLGLTDTLREGLVFKANSGERISFKVVSNAYLLKQKD